MAFTAKIYGNLPGHMGQKRINFLTDTFKLTLHTSTYVPDQDNHSFQSSLTNELATGSGYTAGGATLTSLTFTYNAATNTWTWDAADVTFVSSTLTWRTAVITDTTPGTAATNPLICYFQETADVVSTGGSTIIQFSASGIIQFIVA